MARKRRDVIIVLYDGKGVFKEAKNKSYDEECKKMIVELYESHTTTAANIDYTTQFNTGFE